MCLPVYGTFLSIITAVPVRLEALPDTLLPTHEANPWGSFSPALYYTIIVTLYTVQLYFMILSDVLSVDCAPDCWSAVMYVFFIALTTLPSTWHLGLQPGAQSTAVLLIPVFQLELDPPELRNLTR
jgi:hypothetical protein